MNLNSMFFYIGKDCPLNGINQYAEDLYLDKGWTYGSFGKICYWYKGYSTSCNLTHEAQYIATAGYRPNGKWCMITRKGMEYDIIHPTTLRGFPLYRSNDVRTNLNFTGDEMAIYPETPIPEDDSSLLTIDEASRIIGDILRENTVNFLKYNSAPKLNMLCSAGLDSTTVWAVLDDVTKNYVLQAYVPKPADTTLHSFLGKNNEYQSDLIDKISQDHWGYDVLSVKDKMNWVATGYYAEVMQFRDGEAINAIANYYSRKIHELSEESDYLFHFLNRTNIIDKYKDSMMRFQNDQALKEYLYSTIFYDTQMWHIDNTMTFSPFADIRIPQTVYRMSVTDIARNSVTGMIQRNIINRFKPELLSLVSDYKNSGDVWKNFRDNFSNITLDPKVVIEVN